MTGGSATHAGIGFQDRVAGLLAVHLVADAPVEFFGLPSDVTPTSLELETSAPVDDILTATSAAGFCFINVKKGVTLSQKADSPLGSVLDQFVRLWIACHPDAAAALGNGRSTPAVTAWCWSRAAIVRHHSSPPSRRYSAELGSSLDHSQGRDSYQPIGD